MGQSLPLLSVILVVGPLRNRAQRALDCLCAQTALEKIEIVVVDIAPGERPPLKAPAGAPVRYFRCPELQLWSAARGFGLKHCRGTSIASIEDHAYARPEWAEAVIEAHEGPWAAVGYAFVNANPQTYWSRACLVNDYGPWMVPTPGGETDFVPGHNVSYARAALDSFGDRLETLFALDFSLQDAMRKRGMRMFVAPRAVVAHENFTRIPQMIGVHVAYSRLLASERARVGNWPLGRRLVYALLTPVGAPVIAAYRYAKSFAPRRSMWLPALKALPVFLLTRTCSGPAEAVSYLVGAGGSEYEVMSRWEMSTVRTLAD